MLKRKIDHIVYCVHDLEVAVDYFGNLFGVKPIIGGRHQSKGTKNALLNLGNQCYLEILSVDDNNIAFNGNRWMGIDHLQNPKITRWSLKSEDLESDSRILSKYDLDLSQISEGSRLTGNGNLLSWRMILPGPSPEVELMPFMTDWSHSTAHPTGSLDKGCSLEKLTLYYPNPNYISTFLSDLGVEVEIHEDTEVRIEIVIKSPTGIHTIS